MGKNRYSKLIEHVFLNNYTDGATEVSFCREEIIDAATALSIKLPKNLGDVIYSFRYRATLPDSITEKAPEGCEWIIRAGGRSRYSFVAMRNARFIPSSTLMNIKIPDATPGIIQQYALSDEQALLAQLRYNRIIDIFTGVTCYSLQNHLRTTVPDMGQVETDEIYAGIDKFGAHYIFPVQAKGGNDQIGVVQIEQDFALCRAKFPNLICKPIAAQFISSGCIALFEFALDQNGISVSSEKHYQLVKPESLSAEELNNYTNLSIRQQS